MSDTAAPTPAPTPAPAPSPAPEPAPSPAPAPAPIAAGGDNPPTPAPSPAPAPTPKDFTVPDNWREQIAGEDKGFLNALKRHADFKSAMNWLRATSAKISAGELKAPVQPPAADATPEQVAAWRKEQGLPEKAADYIAGLKLSDGVIPGEADKPLLEAVAEMAHKSNYSQQTVNDFVGLYYGLQDQLAGKRQEADQDQRIAAEQQLIQEMGADFKPNMRALSSFWSEAPKGMVDLLLSARTPDGRVVGNMPEVTSFFAGLARELNPAATILPPGTDGTPASIESRMREIEGQMYIDGKPNPAYFNTPLQAEYRSLIEAQERGKARAA